MRYATDPIFIICQKGFMLESDIGKTEEEYFERYEEAINATCLVFNRLGLVKKRTRTSLGWKASKQLRDLVHSAVELGPQNDYELDDDAASIVQLLNGVANPNRPDGNYVHHVFRALGPALELIPSVSVSSYLLGLFRLKGTSNNSDFTQFNREKLSLINGRHWPTVDYSRSP
jgi:hypothetical protein